MAKANASSALFSRIRARCLSLPDASERESHGSPTFFVREKRSFLNLVASYYGPGGRPAIICAAPEGMQESLVEAKPALYFLPKYVAKLGWIGMWLDAGAKWEELDAVLTAAYATASEKAGPRKSAGRGTSKPRPKRKPAKRAPSRRRA